MQNNCPEEFKLNCKNQDIKCSRCSAESESTILHYTPILEDKDLTIQKHPAFILAKKEKQQSQLEAKKEKQSTSTFKRAQKNVKQGNSIEKKVLKKISASFTTGSGRVFGDGDGYITLENGNRIYIEHKARLAGRNTLGPTKAEWEKAQQQNAEIFIVTNEDNSIVTMSLETLKEILGL